MRERLKAKPSDAMCKYVFQPRIDGDLARSYANLMRVNMAHTVMLNKTGIVAADIARQLLEAMQTASEQGPTSFEINPEFEDLYLNLERHLIAVVGPEVGGRLHTGRSRNDLYATIIRMNVRDVFLRIYRLVLDLRSELIGLAENHIKTVMTGYTHMQPAQPTTLGHYLAGLCNALERDSERLSAAYDRLNLSPLGSAAFAGTSFCIDRSLTAGLLGFDDLVENTIDAVASRDYLLEIMFAFACVGSTLSRFAYDLHIWCTDEFRFVEFDDSMSASSSIMPQKKNPTPVEHIKAKAAHLLGGFVSVYSCLKNIPFGHSKDSGGESATLFWQAGAEIEAALVLATETVKTMSVNAARMESRVNQNFCTATDLADELVRRDSLPFRVAYQIVGSLVGDCHRLGLSASDITAEMLDAKAREYLGEPIGWSQGDLRSALDAHTAVQRRNVVGGPAETQLLSNLSRLKGQLSRSTEQYAERLGRLHAAESTLRAEVDMLKGTEE